MDLKSIHWVHYSSRISLFFRPILDLLYTGNNNFRKANLNIGILMLKSTLQKLAYLGVENDEKMEYSLSQYRKLFPRCRFRILKTLF